MAKAKKILIHLPAYREPELIPTIKNAIENADNPKNLVFGICRQYHPDDQFDNLDEFEGDEYIRTKVITSSDLDCWIYEYKYDVSNFKEIKSGDWMLR